MSRIPVYFRPIMVLVSLAFSALAHAFPAKPVTIVVGFPPGTSSDAIARILGEGLSARWNQPVIVENRPGAGGSIAAAHLVRRQDTSGHTLMLSSSGPVAINPHVYKDLNYAPLQDFVPISQTTFLPYVLVTNGKKGIKDFKGLVQYAKQHPGELSYASLGLGQTSHLLMEILQQRAGITLNHVPYKGSSQAQSDVIGGNVDLTFDTLVTALPQVHNGRLFAVGTSTKKRSAMAPDIPSLDSMGVEGFDSGAWLGIFAPAGTAQQVVDKIHADLNAILNDPDYNKRLTALGSEVVASPNPKAFADMIRKDYDIWGKTVTSIGMVKQ